MGKPFTPERLMNIRRMRKARRLFKKQPLFAFETMCNEYPDYTYQLFSDDLRYRKKPKKRKGKSPLVRFGRYRRMEKLNDLYRTTKNIEYALQSQRLYRRMSQSYRVMVRINGYVNEYAFSPLIPIEKIEWLTAELGKCSTERQADELVDQFRKEIRIY